MLRELSFYLAMVESESDRQKFETIFYRYVDAMQRHALRYVNDYALAEDAVSLALTAIATNMEKIGYVDAPATKALVMLITQRKAIDLYRKQNRERQREISLETMAEPQTQNTEEQQVTDAIRQLPEQYREVLLLKYTDGYGNREIAQLLGYTVTKVDQLVSRGKKRLQKQLKEAGL